VSDQTIRVPAGLTTEGLLGRRYIARSIDSVIGTLLITVGIALGRTFGPQVVNGPLQFLLRLFLVLIVWIGYGTVLEASRWQATLGKRLMGLRVYNSEAGRPAPLQAAARNLVKDSPFLVLGLMPGGGFLSLIWLGAHLVVLHRSPVYQAIHDRAAQTWVAAPEQTIQLHII
jgi:uncharacterized RDD family membrane protein YckC